MPMTGSIFLLREALGPLRRYHDHLDCKIIETWTMLVLRLVGPLFTDCEENMSDTRSEHAQSAQKNIGGNGTGVDDDSGRNLKRLRSGRILRYH